jgi:hypothetical protein
MAKEKFKLPVPGEWFVEKDDEIVIKPPKGSKLTRYTMPEVDAEEDDGYLLFYFFFDTEIEALHFKLQHL